MKYLYYALNLQDILKLSTNKNGFTPHFLWVKKKKIGSTTKKSGGFTLIEATVAIMILVVGLLAVIQFFPFALRITGDSQNLTTASNVALSKIEELKEFTYDNISTGTIETKQRVSTDPDNYLYHYQRQTDIEYIDSYFNTSGADVGLKKITVTVFWQSPISSEEKSLKINTVISNY